jgi:hypothetical protein
VTGFAFVTCLIPSASLAAATPRAERPTYTLGEKWLRSDGAYELIRIEDGRYVFAAGPGQEVHLTKDLAVTKVQRGQAVFEWSPPPALAWPLEVGKWGSSPASWSDRTPAYLTWTVEAYEPVRVPAGTFQAFRIELILNPWPYRESQTLRLWYAPEARQYVKVEAALILETGQRSRFQRMVVVIAPMDVQVERLAQARGLTEVEARQRLAAQWPNADKARLADHVIDNGGDLATTEAQVSQVYAALVAGSAGPIEKA